MYQTYRVIFANSNLTLANSVEVVAIDMESAESDVTQAYADVRIIQTFLIG